jgi:hypothetical protein
MALFFLFAEYGLQSFQLDKEVGHAGSGEASLGYLQSLQQHISQGYFFIKKALFLALHQMVQELLVPLFGEIGEDIGEGLNGELPHVLVLVLHELFSKLLEVGLQVLDYLIVINLHQHAQSVEEVPEEGLAEVGSAGLCGSLGEGFEAGLQPNREIDSSRVLDDSLE